MYRNEGKLRELRGNEGVAEKVKEGDVYGD